MSVDKTHWIGFHHFPKLGLSIKYANWTGAKRSMIQKVKAFSQPPEVIEVSSYLIRIYDTSLQLKGGERTLEIASSEV